MKIQHYAMLLAAATLLLPSCESMGDFDKVSTNQANVASQTLPATVISATQTTIDTSSTSRNIGTGVGAVLGAGAGSLLGRGKGQIVSAAGFGLAGALAGRYLTDSMGRTTAQRLTVQIDGSKTMYTVVQPVYKQFGLIPVGTHGMFQLGGNSQFIPDGAAW